MKRWLADLLSSFRNGNGFLVSQPGHGLRRRPHQLPAPIAAEVQHLEVRQLLTFQFFGGPLIAHVQAQSVFLGSNWSTDSSLQTQAGQIDTFVHTLVTSSYLDSLGKAGYKVGHGKTKTGVTDSATLTGTITDAQIQADLQDLINTGSKLLEKPGASSLYIIYVQPGTEVFTDFGNSAHDFLGYHGAFKGHAFHSTKVIDIRYAVMPYPGSPNYFQSQDFATHFDQLTSVTSHEVSEAVTDPNVSYSGSLGNKALGWYDLDNNGEVGDVPLTDYYYNGGPAPYVTFHGYIVQEQAAKDDSLINPNNYPGLDPIIADPLDSLPLATIAPPAAGQAAVTAGNSTNLTAVFQPLFVGADLAVSSTVQPGPESDHLGFSKSLFNSLAGKSILAH